MKDWDESKFYPSAPSIGERMTFSRPYNTMLCEESVSTKTKVPKQVQDKDEAGVLLTDSISGDPIMITVEVEEDIVTQVPVYGTKWVVTDETKQKMVLGKYERKVRELEKKWNKCQEDKKLVLAMIWGQLDDDTQAQMLSLIHI